MHKKFFSLGFLLSILLLIGAGCISSGSKAAGPMGMYRSLDKGENWQAIQALPTTKGVQSLAGLKVFRIFTDPSDVNALYVGSRHQGLFYSYNRGDAWRAAGGPLVNKFIYALSVDPKDKCTIFVSDGPIIYRTTDCLRTFEIVYTEQREGVRLAAIAVDPFDSNIVYGALTGGSVGDILVSTNGGRNWRVVVRFNKVIRDLQADLLQPGRLYVATQNQGLFRSSDRGNTWIEATSALQNFSESLTFYRLLVHPSKKDSLFWVSKYGILRSNDAGATWQDLELITAPGSVNIYTFAVNPQNEKELYYTGTTLGEGNKPVRSTFYKSADAGKTWVTKKLPTNTIPVALHIFPEDPKILFLGFTLFE